MNINEVVIECKVMKNRKFLGKLPEEQIIRDKPKPFIIEMNELVN